MFWAQLVDNTSNNFYVFFLYLHSQKTVSLSRQSIWPAIKYGGAAYTSMLLNEMEYRIDIEQCLSIT